MFRECWQVKYLSSFPAVEVMTDWSEAALCKFLSEFMFVKHEDWAYEHEWRMSLPIFARSRKPGKEHDLDLNVDVDPPFVTCDPRAIVGVTFGAKMPTHVRNELRNTIRDGGRTGIEFYEAFMPRDQHTILMRRIGPTGSYC
jgi:hypothetical protein